MIHIYPINDEREHEIGDTTTCWCDPKLDLEQPEMLVIHNSADGRELIEQAEAIKQAALRISDGRIFTAPTHCQAYTLLEKEGISPQQVESFGFVDYWGVFKPAL